MNLTAVTEATEVMDRHIEDSLAIISPIQSLYSSHGESDFENLNLVDVGSGAGLPGLILAIACPGTAAFIVFYIHFVSMILHYQVHCFGLVLLVKCK